MGLEDIPGIDTEGEDSDEREYNIKRKDLDRGFRIRVDFDVPDKENTMYIDTWLSPHVEDSPWTRADLVNDVVEEAVEDIIDQIHDDHPDAEFDGARVKEITEVREVEFE